MACALAIFGALLVVGCAIQAWADAAEMDEWRRDDERRR